MAVVVRRSRLLAASALVLALALATLPAGGAAADPGSPSTPSAAQVARARAEAAAAAAVLASADARRADAQARLTALNARLEIAVEAWNAARAEVADARAQLTAAQSSASAARAAAAVAQGDVDRLASASYQMGADLSGGLGEWAAIIDGAFGADGIQGVADRTTSVGLVTADRRRTIEAARELQLSALAAEQAATRAADAVGAREASVAAAAERVKAEQETQKAEVARLVAVRDAAATTLDQAKGRASTLARDRAAAIAKARAAARARAEAERRAREGSGRSPRDPDTSTRPWPAGASTTTAAQRLGALAYARRQLGDPYIAGDDGPDSFDCSGLTTAAYRSVGKSLVQYSQSQFATGRKIPVSQLRPGDLVFFATTPSDWRTIHHVGIYSGGGLMVEAPHTGDVVKYFTIWQDELVAYGARP